MEIIKVVTKKQLVENVSSLNEWVLHDTRKERREKDVWNPKNLHSGDLGSNANALYNFLVKNGDIDTEEYDVYDLIPVGEFYHMTEFRLADTKDTWYVGDEIDTHRSAMENVKDLLDDIGLEGFSENFVKEHINLRRLNNFVYQNISDSVYDEPDAYAETSEMTLSFRQKQYLEFYEIKIKKLQGMLKDESDPEKIDKLMSDIQATEKKIEYIYENPEGEEVDEDKIDEIIERLYNLAKNDPLDYLREFGGFSEKEMLEFLVNQDMIDMDSLVRDVVDTDGYGHTLNTYDGSENEIMFGDTLYYILNNQ